MKIHRPKLPMKKPTAPRAPMGAVTRKPNYLWGKGMIPKPIPKMTFSDLGATDWGALIGTAASVYTGQQNALSAPHTAPAAPAPPIMMYGPPSPVPQQILTPERTPYYKNPLVIGGAVLAVLGLGYVLVRGRRSRR